MFYIGCTAIALTTTSFWKKDDKYVVNGIKTGCGNVALLQLPITKKETFCNLHSCQHKNGIDWWNADLFTVSEEDVNIEELLEVLKQPIRETIYEEAISNT